MGADEPARALVRGEPGAVELDLAGALVTPALVDAHAHTIQVGQVADGLDLHGARSRTAVLDAVAGYVAARPGLQVLVGQGWDERAWPDPSPPARSELDRAAPGVAVYLARVDVHSALVSTTLLDRLPDVSVLPGFTAAGWLTRDAHHACRAQLDSLFTDAQRRSAARTALAAAARVGVATVHELGGPHLGPLQDLVRIGQEASALGIGVVRYWGELAGPEDGPDGALARAASVGAAGLAGDLCIDGAVGSHTAALRQPYADAPTQGARYLSEDEVTGHLVACTRADVQAGFHCIGDDAVDAAVAGLRRAAEQLGAEPVRAARHRLEHLEMVDRADLTTLAELGVVASVQPAFDREWGGPGELYQTRLGGRAATMNPLGDLWRTGVPLALGTDAPVTPLAGWATVQAAVQHSRPEQRLSVPVALAAATRGGHWAARDDASGLVAVGQRGDLAVWGMPPDLREASTGLPRLGPGDPLPDCLATLAAGRTVHLADGLFA